MIKKIVLILLLILIPMEASALMIGATQYWYVNQQTGYDNTNWYGFTTSTPFASIQFALDTLIVGNVVDGETVALPYVIVVSTGLYEPAAQIDIDINEGLSEGQRITLQCDIFGQHFGTAGETTIKPVNAAYVIFIWGMEYITIRGFDLWIYRNGIVLFAGAQADIFCIIEENTARDNRLLNADVDGFSEFNMGEVTFRNNIVSDLDVTTAGKHCYGIYASRSLGVYLYNNTIYNISGQGAGVGACIWLLHTEGGGTNLQVDVKNNILQKSSDYLIAVDDGGNSTSFIFTSDNNCFYEDGATNVGRDVDAGLSFGTVADWRGSIWATDFSSIEGDPAMENVGGTREDYKLRGYSICIDSGVVIPSIKSDNMQKRRTDGSNDIGAHRHSRGRTR